MSHGIVAAERRIAALFGRSRHAERIPHRARQREIEIGQDHRAQRIEQRAERFIEIEIADHRHAREQQAAAGETH